MANDTIQANSSERIRVLITLSVPAIIFGMLSKRCVMYPSVVFSMRMLLLVFLRLMREISSDRSWATVQKKTIDYFFPAVSFINHRALLSSWMTRRRIRIPETLEVSDYIITMRCHEGSSSDRGSEECDFYFSSTETAQSRSHEFIFDKLGHADDSDFLVQVR